MKLEVGQKVYLVWNQIHSPKEVTITKIGRKYAEIDYHGKKIDIESMTVGKSPTYAKVYSSEEEYINETKAQMEWDILRYKISNSYRKPENISFDKIKNILELLK